MELTAVDLLVAALDHAFDRRSWHGTNLRGALRGMTAAHAAWRPAADRHNAWELAVHCAYWKYAVWRQLTGAPRGSFPLRGSNWFARPVDGVASETTWRDDVRLLVTQHEALRAAVAALTPVDLARRPAGSRNSVATLVQGAAAHDLYHAGQIQLLDRLRQSSSTC